MKTLFRLGKNRRRAKESNTLTRLQTPWEKIRRTPESNREERKIQDPHHRRRRSRARDRRGNNRIHVGGLSRAPRCPALFPLNAASRLAPFDSSERFSASGLPRAGLARVGRQARRRRLRANGALPD